MYKALLIVGFGLFFTGVAGLSSKFEEEKKRKAY